MFSFNSKLWYEKRRVSKTGETTIYLQVLIDSLHTEFNLKLRWPVKYIDLTNGILLPRTKQNDPDVSDYNLIIKTEQAKHTEIFRTYRLSNKNLDLKTFRKELQVFDQRESFITYIERERNTRFRKKDIELKTWQNANAVKMAIMQYDNLSLFKNINKKWMDGFKTHLLHYEYAKRSGALSGKRYKPGTIQAIIKTTKTYLQRASCEPLIHVDKSALQYANPKPAVKTTFLNREEIRRLILLLEGDLSDKQLRVLKGWLFMAFTSLRISDLFEANSRWEISDGFLTFIPIKNHKKGKIISIPMLPMARRFLASKNGLYFNLPNQQEFNETLKVLADKAYIKKRLTAHVARHTFGYLYMTTVGNLYGLKEILGHAKVETTERYSHLDEDYQLESTLKIQKGFEDLMLRKVL